MSREALTPQQAALANASAAAKIFLEGPAGTGKSTTGVARVLSLIERGVPAGSLLVFVPQRTLAAPYQAALRRPERPAGGQPAVLTLGGLARRMLELFWPLAGPAAGFAAPDQPPTFLTLETAQYYLARVAAPLLAEGRFRSVALERPRLYSQILDALNKAAAGGFEPEEIGARLSAAWLGDPGQERVYADAQAAALLFRADCLAHNRLDYSLQLEVFRRHLWPHPAVRDYLLSAYRHLIADNVEEDVPAAHDLLAEWLPEFDSALLIYDQDAGYRRLLGADPASAYGLRALCSEQLAFFEPVQPAPALLPALGEALAGALDQPEAPLILEPPAELDPAVLRLGLRRFYPDMLDWVVEAVARCVHAEGTPPGQIAILAPYLGDALRYALMDRLRRAGVPARSHRPSRSLREEPAAHCLLTLAALAHPEWGRPPDRLDLAYALQTAVAGLDLTRAHLLAGIVHRSREGAVSLGSFDQIKPDVQKRLTLRAGGRYEDLRLWLEASRQDAPLELDHFLARLFDEVLSRPGYGFHASGEAAAVAARLIESVRKFRAAVADDLPAGRSVGQEYTQMLADGLLAAQSVDAWTAPAGEAVLIAPAYTFLVADQPVDVQVWLDVGASGWSERLAQPLTHPYVLSRAWEPGRRWTDDDEFTAGQAALYRLSLGLLRRCRRQLILAAADLGEQGYEQRGYFLRALERAFKRLGIAFQVMLEAA